MAKEKLAKQLNLFRGCGDSCVMLWLKDAVLCENDRSVAHISESGGPWATTIPRKVWGSTPNLMCSLRLNFSATQTFLVFLRLEKEMALSRDDWS